MADEVQVIEQPQQQANEPSLADSMKIALNGYQPQQDITIQTGQPKPNEAGNPVADAPQPTAINPFDLIKDKFQYQSPEDAIKEIEELRALKANPTPAQIKYENEQSEKLHKAIQSGDRKTVLQILNQQDQVERLIATEVTKDTAAEIVKTAMSLKYKDQNLSQEEINYKFNKQYGLPPKPTQLDIDTDEDYQQKLATWQEVVNDKTMELLIDAKLAKPEIASQKTKLELPTIDTPIDPAYLEWKKSQDEAVKMDDQVKADYKTFTPDSVKTLIDFNDEANKINFQYQYEPDTDSFKAALDTVMDADKFYQQFFNSDGSPNRKKYFDFVYKGQNADKMIKQAITQGINARTKSMLPDNSGTSGGKLMPIDNIEKSEIDKEMERRGISRTG